MLHLGALILIFVGLFSVAGVGTVLLSARRNENRGRLLQIKPARLVAVEHALTTTQDEYRRLEHKHNHSSPVMDFHNDLEDALWGTIHTRQTSKRAAKVIGTVANHLRNGNADHALSAADVAEGLAQELVIEADGVASQISMMLEGRGDPDGIAITDEFDEE